MKRSRTRVVRRRRTRRGRRPFPRRRAKGGFPRYVCRVLKTNFNSTIDSSGAVSAIQFVVNSAFDPLGAASNTNQPMYYDQYSAIYNKYCVVAYRVKLEAVSTDNTNTVIAGLTCMTDPSTLATFAQYRECPNTVSRVCTPDVDKIALSHGARVAPFLLPQGGKILSEDLCCAITEADPSRKLYLHMWAGAADNTTDVGSIRFIGTLYQTIVFFDRKTVSRSTQ